MKVRILIDDGLGRFKAGEIGEALQHNSTKYKYFIELPGVIHVDNFLGKGPLDAARRYYFYDGEVEELMHQNAYIALDQNLIIILDHQPAGEAREVTFSIKGHLFKAKLGIVFTRLFMWTANGWCLFQDWQNALPLEPDIHDLATRIVVALESEHPAY